MKIKFPKPHLQKKVGHKQNVVNTQESHNTS
jgi:hypothetical protein